MHFSYHTEKFWTFFTDAKTAMWALTENTGPDSTYGLTRAKVVCFRFIW